MANNTFNNNNIINGQIPNKEGNYSTRYELESNRFNKKNDIPKTKEVKIPSVEIPLDIVKSKKRLTLTIFESKFLTEGTVLNINPGGLEGSERMCRDGIILFGISNVYQILIKGRSYK